MHEVSTALSTDGTARIAFGADYNPEQWTREVWHEDVAAMREAGVNLVSVGIFSWAKLEPAEGHFELDWLAEVLDLLHAADIRVDLANATASPPPWFSHRYPQSLPVTSAGVRLGYGSRQAFCSASVDYRRAAARLTTVIAERFAAHPAVVMWHVHNEYGCHNLPCYCDASERSFRVWLERKYTTIDALNEAWGTAFWSQGYSTFEEVTVPRLSGTFVNPTQQLDFARFSSDDLLECFDAEATILRAHSSAPVTTNFMGFFMDLGRPLDYWEWADQMDIVSNDHYLIASDPRGHQDLAMTSDFIRSLAGGSPWLLMEHSTSAVNWQPRNRAKSAGEMLRNSMQHVARGADGVLFFQWRASQAGSEKFHSAMFPHAGRDSRVWREVVELGEALGNIAEVAGSRVVDADVAIIHDTDARWASQLDAHPSIDTDMMAETRRWHDALYRSGLACDFRRSTDPLDGYRLVIVPMTYLITDAGAANIAAYVASGGRVVVTYFSGIVNEDDHVRLGGYPGAFRELLGLRIEEFYPLADGEAQPLTRFGSAGIFSELGRSVGAEVLAEYGGGPTAGSPAVTRNVVSSGVAYYVGTSLVGDGLLEFLALVAADASVEPAIPAADGVEIVRRSNGSQSWSFVINHSDVDVSVAIRGHELLRSEAVDDTLSLPAGRVAVIRERQTAQ